MSHLASIWADKIVLEAVVETVGNGGRDDTINAAINRILNASSPGTVPPLDFTTVEALPLKYFTADNLAQINTRIGDIWRAIWRLLKELWESMSFIPWNPAKFTPDPALDGSSLLSLYAIHIKRQWEAA